MLCAEELHRLVQDCQTMSASEKILFSAVFARLAQEQERALDEIGEHTVGHWPDLDSRWTVVTGLTSEKDMNCLDGLYPPIRLDILPGERFPLNRAEGPEYTAGTVFLNCTYPALWDYCDREQPFFGRVRLADGPELEIHYHLRFSMLLLEKEQLVEQTAMQYGIGRPFLFSPWSRRAARVVIDLSEIPQNQRRGAEINLDFASNHLTGVVLTGLHPVWNVEITDGEDMPAPAEAYRKERIPQMEQDYDRYVFDLEHGDRKNEFLHVDPHGKLFRRSDTDPDEILLPSKTELPRAAFSKVSLHPFQALSAGERGFFFTNCVRSQREPRCRIRTLGDVEYAMRQFCPEGLLYQGCATAAGETVKTYEKEHAYHYPSAVQLRRAAPVYLRFKPEGGDSFFEDRVSYLTAFLNYWYPEFHWAGVR